MSPRIDDWPLTDYLAILYNSGMAIWEDEATYLMSSYFVSAALHDIESGRVPDYTRKSDIEHPSLMKKLGRKVRNFDDVIWKEKRFGVVVKGKY